VIEVTQGGTVHVVVPGVEKVSVVCAVENKLAQNINTKKIYFNVSFFKWDKWIFFIA